MEEIRRERALYVLRVLFEKSNEDEPLSMTDLCEALTEYGVHAERKAIYRDIDCLREFGFRICMKRYKGGAGYFAEPYPFTSEEIDMIRDAVALAEFVPLRDCRNIQKKIAQFSPMRKVNGAMAVPIRMKAKNQYPDKYTLLRAALNGCLRVTFLYEGERKREAHFVSVFGLIRSENGLCAVAGSTEEKTPLTCFELDKISGLSVTAVPAEGIRAVTGDFDFDLEQYLAAR